jgi:hypothetical protein
MSKSWKPQVQVVGEGDNWYDNALRFATPEEAIDNARVLSCRWLLVTNYRAATSNEPVNYRWVDGHLEAADLGVCKTCATQGHTSDSTREDGTCYRCGGSLEAVQP